MEKRIAVLRRVWKFKSKAWLDIAYITLPWSTLLQRLILPEVKGHKTTWSLANLENRKQRRMRMSEMSEQRTLRKFAILKSFWLVTLLWAKRMIYTGLIPESCRKSILDNYPGSQASLEDLADELRSENHFVLQVNLLIKFLLHTLWIGLGNLGMPSAGFCTSSKSGRQERGVDCFMAHVKQIAILKGEVRCPKLQGCFLC